MDSASQFPAFFNPRWASLIHDTAKRTGAELVLVRDLPLAPTAIRAARRLGVPVVLDMAEHYAAMMRDLWLTGSTKPGDFVVRNPRLVELLEKWVLQRVDHTLVVVEESGQRLIRAGLDPERVSVVGNTPPLARVKDFEQLRISRQNTTDPTLAARGVNLIYLGIMEEARGVRQVIEAVAIIRGTGGDLTLDLIGDGRSLQDFRAYARSLRLDERAIRFHGFVPYQDALEIVARMDAGLIPHFANESWESTIPNKLFDYMSLGLPVIASDVTPVKRVLSETGAGVTFRDRDITDLVRVLEEFRANLNRQAMGTRGVEAIQSRYHFERDVEVLERVLTHSGRAARS